MESDDISEELLGYLTDTNFDEVANKGLNDDGQSSDEDNEGANNEDDDSADKIPEHRFDVRITTGKFGAMKGVERSRVMLTIGNHIYRKRKVCKNGSVIFNCVGCEKNKKYVCAMASVEGDEYQLIDFPHTDEHICWAAGVEDAVRRATSQLYQEVSREHSGS